MSNAIPEPHRKRVAAPGPEQHDAKRARSEDNLFADLIECAQNIPSDDPTEITDEDRANRAYHAKSALREHIGVEEDRHAAATPVLFFIELSPYSSGRGASCQHPACDEKIKEDSYRVAVHPGMNNYYGSAGMAMIIKRLDILRSVADSLADFYHVRCFEELVDFSEAAYLDRVTPITRNTVKLRGVKGTSIADGNYLLDGGAERLILEWKTSMGRLMDIRDGKPIEPLDREFNDLLRKSGSASYTPKIIEGMTDFEFINLSHTLAPIESDGVDDQEEWNLFHEYLPSKFQALDDLKEPYSLSAMLGHWAIDKVQPQEVSSPDTM